MEICQFIGGLSITKAKCPYCNELNFLTHGLPLDASDSGVDGLTCFNCKKDSIFQDTLEYHEIIHENAEEQSINTLHGMNKDSLLKEIMLI